jgi:hypothetical protein
VKHSDSSRRGRGTIRCKVVVQNLDLVRVLQEDAAVGSGASGDIALNVWPSVLRAPFFMREPLPIPLSATSHDVDVHGQTRIVLYECGARVRSQRSW